MIGPVNDYRNIYVSACGRDFPTHREGVDHERECSACSGTPEPAMDHEVASVRDRFDSEHPGVSDRFRQAEREFDVQMADSFMAERIREMIPGATDEQLRKLYALGFYVGYGAGERDERRNSY